MPSDDRRSTSLQGQQQSSPTNTSYDDEWDEVEVSPRSRSENSVSSSTSSFGDESSHEKYEGRPRSRASSPSTPITPPARSTHNLHRLDEEEGSSAPTAKSQLRDSKPVSWGDLPRKSQLAILTLARLAEPIAQTSLFSYMFFMLKSFDPSLSDASISTQAGILSGSFTAAQCVTAVLWGRMADKESVGRKNVLLIGLLGTMVSIVGFGFSTSFYMAVFCRTLGGALNGNVSVMRTMVSEMIVEKRFQPKAFLIMPVTFNVGVMVGPPLGGWLQDPVTTFPSFFGPGSMLGGSDGVQWLQRYPYALPNLITGVFLLCSTLLVLFGLEETHIDRKHRHDHGLAFSRTVTRFFSRLFFPSTFTRPDTNIYTSLPTNPTSIELSPTAPTLPSLSKSRPKLPTRRIFTKNVLCTFLTHGLLALHLSAFSNTYTLFLSTPRAPLDSPRSLPFLFTGGLGLDPPTIGFAVGFIGLLGLTMQFGVYSRVTHRIGILGCYRWSLLLFPLTYLLSPFLAVLPTSSPSPAPADGPLLWAVLAALLFIQVTGRTFALPSTQILVNNCSPHPSVLGAVHGFAQSVSAGARTVGPIVWSSLYGVGLRKGVVGLAWWVLGIEAVAAWGSSWGVREGDGHEIWLEGDE